MARKRREPQRADQGVRGRVVTQRQRRVGEELRHVVAQILRDGAPRDPVLRDASITVTEVQISPDLRSATVYVMPLAGGNSPAVLAALTRGAAFLRGRVGQELALRHVPNLAFALDETFDHAARIAALLAQPEVERDLHPAPSEDGETQRHAC